MNIIETENFILKDLEKKYMKNIFNVEGIDGKIYSYLKTNGAH